MAGFLLCHDLEQDALATLVIKLCVEDLLPGAEVELPASDGDDDLAVPPSTSTPRVHDASLENR
jgi:hypothetical protein